jgi:hypothetical protein
LEIGIVDEWSLGEWIFKKFAEAGGVNAGMNTLTGLSPN